MELGTTNNKSNTTQEDQFPNLKTVLGDKLPSEMTEEALNVLKLVFNYAELKVKGGEEAKEIVDLTYNETCPLLTLNERKDIIRKLYLLKSQT
jgi:hypothetical protein